MSSELGVWLRQQREARGWTMRDTARRLIDVGHAAGDKSMPAIDGMVHNMHRWERGQGGLSERYKIYYCTLLGIAAAQFGISQASALPVTVPPATAVVVPAPSPAPGSVTQVPVTAPGAATPALLAPAAFAYRGTQESDMGDSAVQREVLMTAHDSSQYAEGAEQRGIGDATLEQLRADVARLSHEYMTGDPLPLFLEMRRVRDRMHDALDRRMWPRDAMDLYFLLGCINALLAVTADGLGNQQAAEELIRAGWAYAVAIDHRPLMARLRLELARIVYWSGRPRQSLEIGRSGLQYLNDGPNAALLHLICGRASGHVGDADSARAAVSAAEEAREREHADELIDIGGAFGFTRAYHHCLAGTDLALVPGAENEAIAELERALDRYAAGRRPDGQPGYWGDEAHARIELATARLRAGGLDAAVGTLELVLSLPPGRRIDPLRSQIRKIRAELAAPVFRGSVQARELDERIEEFDRDTITAGLDSLTRSAG